MIEQELLMLPAALLLVAARPRPALLWGLPRLLRRLADSAVHLAVWRGMAEPITATAIQALVIWEWYMPGPFDLALDHEGWHIVQHLCFVVSAILFWWAMLNRSIETLAVLCRFATSMIGGALGALMALSMSPWYAAYGAMGMTPFGLTPAEDQQFAGLIMWIPGGLFHLGAALGFLGRWLTRKERRDAIVADLERFARRPPGHRGGRRHGLRQPPLRRARHPPSRRSAHRRQSGSGASAVHRQGLRRLPQHRGGGAGERSRRATAHRHRRAVYHRRDAGEQSRQSPAMDFGTAQRPPRQRHARHSHDGGGNARHRRFSLHQDLTELLKAISRWIRADRPIRAQAIPPASARIQRWIFLS
jgi:hypothetical protein